MQGKRRLFTGLTVVMALLMAAMAALSGCGSDEGSGGGSGKSKDKVSGYESVISDFVKSIQDEDGKMLVNAYSETYIDWLLDQYDVDRDEYIDAIQEYVEVLHDGFEDEVGDNLRLSYKIEEVEDMSEDELEDWKADYRDADMEIDNITAVKEVEVTLIYEGDEDKDEDTDTITVVNDKNGWRLWPE